MVDLITLLLLLLLCSTVLGVSTLVVAARTGRLPGLATWGWALMANAASYLAFGLRVLDWQAVSIIATNLLTPVSMALFVVAILQFHQIRPSTPIRLLVWSPVVLGALVGVVLVEQHETRNALSVLLHSTLMLMQAWAAWRQPEQSRRLAGELLIMTGATAVFLTFIWRAVLMLGSEEFPAPFFVPPSVQTATYLVVFVALLTNTMGFMLMQMERAVHRQRDLATRDPLTGVFNRRAFLDVMGRSLGQSQRSQRPLALLMIDIDHFKQVNDAHGHAGGDAVLREVARRLQARLRRTDLLARFGGEEFVVLLPDTSREQAVVVAEDLRVTVADHSVPLSTSAEGLAVTVSIGVHARVVGLATDEADQMLAACDLALYRAKSLGRNRVEVDR